MTKRAMSERNSPCPARGAVFRVFRAAFVRRDLRGCLPNKFKVEWRGCSHQVADKWNGSTRLPFALCGPSRRNLEWHNEERSRKLRIYHRVIGRLFIARFAPVLARR